MQRRSCIKEQLRNSCKEEELSSAVQFSVS